MVLEPFVLQKTWRTGSANACAARGSRADEGVRHSDPAGYCRNFGGTERLGSYRKRRGCAAMGCEPEESPWTPVDDAPFLFI